MAHVGRKAPIILNNTHLHILADLNLEDVTGMFLPPKDVCYSFDGCCNNCSLEKSYWQFHMRIYWKLRERLRTSTMLICCQRCSYIRKLGARFHLEHSATAGITHVLYGTLLCLQFQKTVYLEFTYRSFNPKLDNINVV